MISTASFLALTMQCAATVHPDTALDVAKTESGLNPYAIAEIIPKSERTPGGKSFITHLPNNKDAALSIIEKIEGKKRRYSVGLMQITSTNFSQYGMTAEKLLSPCNNLAVFEKIIADCYQRGGTLKRALSCYYSGNFDTGQKAESDLNQTSYIQRIGYSPPKNGYAVPSTKADRTDESVTPEHASSPSQTPVYQSWDVLRQYPRYEPEPVQNKPSNQPANEETEKNV